MKREPMTTNMTYESLLDTFDSFEAYLPFVTKKFDDDLWLKTRTENTTQAYELYLSTLPNGIHKQEATANINKIKRQQEEKAEQEKQEAQRQRELEEQRKKEQAIADDKAAYERAKRTNTKAAYEKYLKNFANGVYRTEAKAKADHFRKLEQEEQARIQQQREAETQHQKEQAIANDHQAYESAKRTNTKPAYESYLRSYPYGLHKAEATTKLNEFLEVERALAAQHQQELAAQQVKAQSEYDDHQAFEEAKRINTRASYTDYLTFFPNGIHKGQCEKYRDTIYDFSGKPLSDVEYQYIKENSRIWRIKYHQYLGYIEIGVIIKGFIFAAINEYGIYLEYRPPFSSSTGRIVEKYISIDFHTFQKEIISFLDEIKINNNHKNPFKQRIEYLVKDKYFNYELSKNENGINLFISNGKYGLKRGSKIIIHPQYDLMYYSASGYFRFIYRNIIEQRGIVSCQGELFIETDYLIDSCHPDSGVFIIKKDDKYGLMNIATKRIVVYPEYDLMRKHMNKPYFLVFKGLKSGFIDCNGSAIKKVKLRLPSLNQSSNV